MNLPVKGCQSFLLSKFRRQANQLSIWKRVLKNINTLLPVKRNFTVVATATTSNVPLEEDNFTRKHYFRKGNDG